jgi:hypothetical protein
MRTCGRWVFLFAALVPVPAMAQPTRVTSLPRPAADAPNLQQAQAPDAPFIPGPDVPTGPPTTAMEVFTHPERRFAFTAEAQVLFPVVREHMQALVTVPGFYSDNARLPFADQGLTGALAFGLRARALGGELGVTYRWLASEGDGHLSGFDPTGDVPWRSRLDMHHLDLDYSSLDLAVYPRWLVRWDFGARLASIFFDTQASGPFYDRHISNYFFGAGPHAGLRLTRVLGDSGVAVMSRVDAGAVIGRVHQQFADTVFDGMGNGIGFGYTSQAATQGIPVLVVELGLGAAPGNSAWGQWQVGYQFEQWWGVGNVGASRADLINQGMYARWVFCY